MSWEQFPWVMAAVLPLWAAGLWRQACGGRGAWPLMLAGWVVLAAYVAGLWWGLGRPPLRTLAETRLMYSVLLPVAGALVSWRWGFRWPLAGCVALAGVFCLVTLAQPQTHDRSLMPALRSAWFVPHVTVYMMAYALLSASALAAARGLWQERRGQDTTEALRVADATMFVGFAFHTLGMVFGALWAKKAWGHYWAWDPKETWAFVTWILYLAHLHVRARHREWRRGAFICLLAAWLVLLVCWFGVHLMPSASTSVHTYARP